MSRIVEVYQSWKTRRYESKRVRFLASSASESIALGYAHTRKGVGGVRNHLNAIKKYSSRQITLFPDEQMAAWAEKSGRWKEVDQALCSLPLDRYQLMHSHVNPGFIAACERAHRKGTPWVHTYHTLYFPDHWGGKLEPWQEEINRALIEEASKADILISISSWLHDLLESEYGIKTRVIPNGVDVEKCRSVNSLNSDQSINSPYVLFSGNLKAVKNPLLFISLAARVPDLDFVMIGQDLLPAIVTKFYGRPLPHNLRLLGPVSHERALAYTKTASAVVVTSHSEGLPTVVMEAMAMGRPVIVPDSFGCRELVSHLKTGFVYSPGEIDDLHQCLLNSIDNAAIGEAAFKFIRKNFAWSSVATKLDRIYEELIVGHV